MALEKVPRNFEDRAFLGDLMMAKNVDDKANELLQKHVLSPIDEVEARSVNGRAIGIVNSLKGGADQVSGLLKIVSPGSGRPENEKVKAEEALDVLGKSVFVVMRFGGDQKLRDSMNTPGDVDAILPDALKGIGERVMSNVIESKEIIGELKRLDELREEVKNKGPFGKTKLRKGMEASLERLDQMIIEPEHVDERNLAIAYISTRLVEEISEENSHSPVAVVSSSTVTSGPQRGGYDGKAYGMAEGMERVASIPIPEDMLASAEVAGQSIESAKKWVEATLVRISENPLFFAQWWQQGVANQLSDLVTKQLGLNMFSSEFAEVRDHSYAVMSVLGMQAVDRNAGGSSDNYGQFAPPKDMAPQLHWDDGGDKYNLLKADPVINLFLKEIFDNAFDRRDGWMVVKAFSDGVNYDSQNSYLTGFMTERSVQERLRELGISESEAKVKGRIAMAMFEVDWMPEWIRWANESKRAHVYSEPGQTNPDIPWLDAFDPGAKVWEKFSYSGKLKTKPNRRSQETFEIGYDHPRVLRPWEVAVGAKGSYRDRPNIIWGMERVLSKFMEIKLSTPDGRWIRASGADGTGANALDRYAKYGKFMNEIFGGPAAPEFDNLTTLEKIAPAAANFLGGNVHGNPKFGEFLSHLFALKAEAMFHSEYIPTSAETLARIKGLDVLSGEKEKQTALQGVLGPSGNLAHGWVAEVARLQGINLLEVLPNGHAKYPEFVNAYMKVFMDEPNLEKAKGMYKEAMRALEVNKYVALTSGTVQILKTLSGVK